MRRVREYGFLHCKAKPRLTPVQLILRVLTTTTQRPQPPMCYPHCRDPMRFINIAIPRRPVG